MNNKEFLNFTRNLKQTEFGIKFGKKLFTQPHSLTPKQISIALRQLGLNLPREVVLGADLAQAIVSAQATMTAIETGKNINEITKLSATSANLCAQLANDLGWVDDDSAAFVSLGTDVCLLFASAGTNVQAWVGLAIDLVNISQMNVMAAKKAATNALVDSYSTQIKSQGQALAKSFLDFQSGQIGLFGLLAQTADNSPFLFESNIKNNPSIKNILPGLNFIPVVNWEMVAQASSKNFLGQVSNESARVTVRTIGEMNEEEAANFIFQWVIEPFTICYLEAEKYYRSKKLPSIFDISLLWAVDTSGSLKYISDSDGTQIPKSLLKNLLTPKDIFIDDFFSDYYPEVKSAGISGALGNFFVKQEPTKEQVFDADNTGDIERLYNFKKTRKILASKTTFPLVPPTNSVPWRESTYKTYTERETRQPYRVLERDLQHWYGGQATDWRKLQNFIACLDFLDLVRNDPYYKNLSVPLDRVEQYDIFPSINEWKNKVALVQGISQARKVNKLALTNVAYFLGANNPNQIKMKNKTLEPGMATVWE